MRVQQSVEISAPPEKVWPFLVEPEKILTWWTTLEKFEPVGERRNGVGAAFYVEERAGGPLMKMSFEAAEWVENEKVALHMTAGKGVKGYEQSLRLEAVPASSRLTFMEDVQLPYGVIGKVMGVVGKRTAEGHVKEMLAKLKSAVEE